VLCWYMCIELCTISLGKALILTTKITTYPYTERESCDVEVRVDFAPTILYERQPKSKPPLSSQVAFLCF
jgi:hypothetical protein